MVKHQGLALPILANRCYNDSEISCGTEVRPRRLTVQIRQVGLLTDTVRKIDMAQTPSHRKGRQWFHACLAIQCLQRRGRSGFTPDSLLLDDSRRVEVADTLELQHEVLSNAKKNSTAGVIECATERHQIESFSENPMFD